MFAGQQGKDLNFLYYHMKHNLVYWNMICYVTFLFYFLVCLYSYSFFMVNEWVFGHEQLFSLRYWPILSSQWMSLEQLFYPCSWPLTNTTHSIYWALNLSHNQEKVRPVLFLSFFFFFNEYILLLKLNITNIKVYLCHII